MRVNGMIEVSLIVVGVFIGYWESKCLKFVKFIVWCLVYGGDRKIKVVF